MAGLFGRLARPQASITEMSMEEWARLVKGSHRTSAGIDVSPESAMRLSTCLICARILSESVAGLPLILYKRRADGGKDRATDHPLYWVLHSQANEHNTAFEFTEGSMVNLATRGNAFSYIERDSRGRVKRLTPLNPDGMKVEMARDWGPAFTGTLPGDKVAQPLARKTIHHVRGPMPSKDGLLGRSIIGMAKDAFGLAIAAETFGGAFYANGLRPSGTLKHPKQMSKPAQDRLRAQIEEQHGGAGNGQKMLILEEGMEWVATSIRPDEAQFLETRKYQRSDIFGLFRVPPHMGGDLERATFSNIEHMSLDFVMHTLRPWLTRIQQAVSRDLLTETERQEYFAEFLIDDLLRGDFKSRMEGFAQQIQNGILSPDEIRAMENRNPRADGKGGEYWKPSNMSGDAPPTDPNAV